MSLAFGSTDAENLTIFSRILESPTTYMLCAAAAIIIQLGSLIDVLLGVHNPVRSASLDVLTYPWSYFLLLPAFYFSRRNSREGRAVLVQLAAFGDKRIAPLAEPQPEPLAPEDIPTDGETIGPVAPLWSLQNLNMSSGAGKGLYAIAVMPIILGGLAILLALLLTAGAFGSLGTVGILVGSFLLLVGTGLVGMGLWLIRSARRAIRKAYAHERPFEVTVESAGVSRDAYYAEGMRREYLDWRDVDVFCVAEYRDTENPEGHFLYFLQAGATRLAWEWSSETPDEEGAASDLLVGLAMAQTGLPLRDLTPGISALSAALGHDPSLKRTPADQEFAALQPDMLSAWLARLNAWNRYILALLIASGLLALVSGVVKIIS